MAGASPSLTLLPIDTRQTGWEAQLDQNLQAIVAWVRDQPTQIKRAYHASASQPTSGANAFPATIRLKDYPAANYKGHLFWLEDASTVTGYLGGSNAWLNSVIASNGTNWTWIHNGAAIPAAS